MPATSTLSARTLAALVKGTEYAGRFQFQQYGAGVRVVAGLTPDEIEAALLTFLAAEGFTVETDDLGFPRVTR